MTRAWSWAELAAATLSRQFPSIQGDGQAAVVDLVRRVGPIQSQAARAPFITVSSRLPGTPREAVAAAYDASDLVRSTSLRGTVHTSTREQHAHLAAVAVRTLTPQVRRMLRMEESIIQEFRSVLERLTESGWTEHDELLAGVVTWMRSRQLEESIVALEMPGPRYTLRGHPALLRRPQSSSAGWESQAVAYRSARFAIGEQLVDPQDALVALVSGHVAASGPVTRRDLAWWSGAGLRSVDAAVSALGDELVRRPGPNGLDYLDLADVSERLGDGNAAGDGDVGPRLLPEYDALLLAYDPAARDRFADAAAVAYTWNRTNGVHAPTVLVDGRIRGRWRLDRSGSSAVVVVEMLPAERAIDPGDLTDQASAVGTALALNVDDVTVCTGSA